eukprot:8172384-Pyramimonas_sp.AAC.1
MTRHVSENVSNNTVSSHYHTQASSAEPSLRLLEERSLFTLKPTHRTNAPRHYSLPGVLHPARSAPSGHPAPLSVRAVRPCRLPLDPLCTPYRPLVHPR